ncbi:MAG: hypothetical protein RIT49_528, partial [Actinomycetota bacterium]
LFMLITQNKKGAETKNEYRNISHQHG